MRAELAEVIMQQVQRLALVLKEENAKLKRQMEAMPQVICARLKETSRVDAEAPGTFVQRASSRTSEGPVWSSQNSGTIQDLQRHACNSQQVSEGGWSDDDAEQMQLAASAEQDGRQPGRPPSGRRTPQEKPSMRRRQQLPLLRDPQRRPSQAHSRPSQVQDRSSRSGFPPLPPASNASGFELQGAPRSSGDIGCDERFTHNSNFSVTPGAVQNLRGLDDFLTNSLFESHGLMGPSRPSFGSREPRSTSTSLEQAGASLKAFFWAGSRPASEPSAPAGSAYKVGGRRASDHDTTVGAEPPSAPPGAMDDFSGIGSPPSCPSVAADNDTRSTDRERCTTSDMFEMGSGEESAIDGLDPLQAGGLASRNWSLSRSPSSWGATRFVQRISTTMMPTASGMDRLRVERESGLIASHVISGGGSYAAEEWEAAQQRNGRPWASMALAVSGITPFGIGRGNWLYGNTLLIAVAMLLTGIVMTGRNVASGISLYFHMSAGCIGFCSFFGLVSLRFQQIQDLLGPRRRPLEFYACAFGFWDEWHRMSGRCFTVVIALWACSTLSQTVMNLHFECPQAGEASFAACGISFSVIGLLCATFYCKLHICCGLELAIDHYCIRVFENQDLANGIVEWNVLQAMLRRAAHVVEASFVAVSTGVLGVVVLTSLEFVKMFGEASSSGLNGFTARDGACMGLWTTWVAPPVALVFYFVFRAAAITEKCNRVPALVNSWMLTDRHIDLEKQYVVQYIMHSAAGYYVMGARLNATWALKLSYLFGVLLFSLLTQSVLKGS